MTKPMNVGIYVFEDMTMLDGYAPLQMLSLVEKFNTFTFGKTESAVQADCGVPLTPKYGLDSCPPIDILIMPGGGDVLPQMQDAELMRWLKETAPAMSHITSVCTGALILAEAGLLDGYKAVTHWGWVEQLAQYPGIEVVDQRVVVDRNRITGGGITAGLDFSLTLIAEVVGAPAAQAIQLLFEYRPQPPFDSGSPTSAPSQVRDGVTAMIESRKVELRAHLAEKHRV
ncbi:MAG: cyclohexyl-isocyanide hydratase [Gammaproteobacteria bacterium]|jgi:cyclohexyl-isocyanide hydratase